MSAVQEYIQNHPTASTLEVANKLGVTRKAVYNARNKLRLKGFEIPSQERVKKNGAAKKEAPPKKPSKEILNDAPGYLKVQIDLPEEGLQLKLKDNGAIFGTFLITKTGLKFFKAKQKKVPERELSWKVLNHLMEIGLLE